MSTQIFIDPHPDSDGFVVDSMRTERNTETTTYLPIADGHETYEWFFGHRNAQQKMLFLGTLKSAVQDELDRLRGAISATYQPVFPDHTCGTILTADESFNPAAFDAEMGEPVVGQECEE